MSFILKAILPIEGIGIVLHEGKLRLIRPPYNLSACPSLPEGAAQDAILRHDFHVADMSFSSWEEVIHHLKEELIKTSGRYSSSQNESVDIREFLQLLSEEDLTHYLDNVETSLIPDKEYGRAQSFLFELIVHSGDMDLQAIHSRAVRLLKMCIEEKDKTFQRRSQLVVNLINFPHLNEKSREQSARISKIVQKNGVMLAHC